MGQEYHLRIGSQALFFPTEHSTHGRPDAEERNPTFRDSQGVDALRYLSAGQYVIHAPWVLAAPGTAILLTVLGFNLVGDSLRDALDPRLAATFGKRATRESLVSSWKRVGKTK